LILYLYENRIANIDNYPIRKKHTQKFALAITLISDQEHPIR